VYLKLRTSYSVKTIDGQGGTTSRRNDKGCPCSQSLQRVSKVLTMVGIAHRLSKVRGQIGYLC
jgi:hypothetical protein